MGTIDEYYTTSRSSEGARAQLAGDIALYIDFHLFHKIDVPRSWQGFRVVPSVFAVETARLHRLHTLTWISQAALPPP